MSSEVVIVGIARTPMGGLQGSLSDVSATELGAQAIRGALRDANLAPDQVDEVLMGCVAGVSEAGASTAGGAWGRYDGYDPMYHHQ